MEKRNVYRFHKKYPFAESIFLFLLGIFVGFFINMFTGNILSEQISGWQIIKSYYFFVTLALIFIGVVYYWKFSSFSINQKNTSSIKAADTIIHTLANETKKMLESDAPITYEKRLTLARKTAQLIKEVDKKLLGSDTYEN